MEAAIASVHVTAKRVEDTDWAAIVSLYDHLIAIRPSPVIALNRAIAIAQREGARRGLDEIRAIRDSDRLVNYPFYHAALGEFELREGNRKAARDHFKVARDLWHETHGAPIPQSACQRLRTR